MINLQRLRFLMGQTEKNLRKFIIDFLKEKYDEDKITISDSYILAAGEGEFCLIAHMDTVYASPPTVIFHDPEQKALWSPEGLGADDRAGIEAILEVLDGGFRPSIIFTTGEEMGGIGASQLVKDFPNSKEIFPDVKFLIQLDRRGFKDCVFYQCDNPTFTKWVESYGFKTAEGSYTDISILGPAWNMAAVNLSIGYFNEHSYTEMLFYSVLQGVVNTIIRMHFNCLEGRGPANTTFMLSKQTDCPICKNKLTGVVKDISKYNLGVKYICEKCYKECFEV